MRAGYREHRVDHHGRRALTRAVVHAHDHAAIGLDSTAYLVDHAAHRAAGDQNALGIRRNRALARVVGLAQLGNLLLQLIRIASISKLNVPANMVLIRSTPLMAAGWLACSANISSWAARKRLRRRTARAGHRR